MVRIRKKTSNRTKTHERRKLHNKLREGKKKKAKAAKKDVTWKSKHKKDPGIPNNYPFKDQLLAEVAEQRRIKTAKKAADAEAAEQDAAAELSDDGDFDGVASISAKKLNVATVTLKDARRAAAAAEAEEDEEEDAPMLMDPDLPNLRAVLDKADVVVEVLDARDPQTFRSAELEKYVSEAGKKAMFVMNKIDLCPREAVAAWYSHLSADRPTFLFRSSSSCLPPPPVPDVKGKGKAPSNDAIGAGPILEQLQKWAVEKKGDEPLTVAVVGVTNSGKSSLVNSLLKKPALPIYTLATSSRGPTTTEVPHEVTLNEKVTIVDTPGLSWVPLPPDDETANVVRARDILMRNKGRIDRLKDPEPAVDHFVLRATTEDLMLLYNLPAFMKEDSTAFLTGVARAKQLIKKHGAVDLTNASRVVLRDWSTGRIKWYTPGPTSSAEPSEAVEAILSRLPTRKELRRAGGLVKLTPGAVDERAVELDAPWVRGAEPRAGAESDEEDGDVDMEGEDEDSEEEDENEDDEEDEDEDDEEEEEEELPSPPPSKRKRGAANDKSLPPPPAKKVAFATRTKVSVKSTPTAAVPAKSVLKASKEVKVAKGVKVTKETKVAKEVKTPKTPKSKTPAKPTKAPKVANVGKKGAAKPADGEYDFSSFF
ncbi:P-loop containing nucleoside triphosphate hydrolase protein [Schizophyllum commune Tattone D]|nr:P-loop containing nucleoside triphosphate hydrolase protein [Schizophyllum commune Tattone D]